ncbi:hypothetical protein [Archangium sp.]|uniref:hypothetical protein n=1 Tax=Archangium sp. TaxID=1872627 RepID=UPI002D5B1350|nr:hypothetical protein [Archangium sp.]HYO55235.1 hypothetical protein [Archangium sp.]
MAEGEDRTEPVHVRTVFEQPATLREPAAPSVPRVMPPSAVSVIPLSGEEQAPTSEPCPTTPQEAREATDALLREILEEDLAGTSEPGHVEPPARPSRQEDWPAELHSLHLPEE